MEEPIGADFPGNRRTEDSVRIGSTECSGLAPTSCLPLAARLALSSPSPRFPSLNLAVVVRARRETLLDEHTKACRGGGPEWANGGDARVVALEQADVHAVCSLRAGNKQPRASVRTSGASNALALSLLAHVHVFSLHFNHLKISIPIFQILIFFTI